MPNDLMDDLDPVIRAELESKRARFKATVSSAVTVNPDEVAKHGRLAAFLDQPRGVVEAMPAEAERSAAIKTLADNAATSPVLQRKYTDADFARLAHDDSGALSSIAAAAKWLVSAPDTDSNLAGFARGTGSAMLSALPKFNEGAWGLARAGADLLPDVIGDPLADTFARYGKQQRSLAADLMPKSDNVVGASWYSGMQSLGLNVLQLPLGMGGKMAPILTSMGLNTGGQAYGEARDQGKGTAQSLLFGASQGVIEAGTEMLGMPALLGMLKPGKFGAKAIEYLWKEQLGEQAATHMQDLNEWAVLHPEKTFGDYLQERPNAALQTALSTAFSGGGQVAIMKAINVVAGAEQSAQQAEQHAQVLEAVQKTAEASKLLERSPDTLRSYMQELVDEGVPTVYVDSTKLVEAGVDLQALAQAMPSVAAQIDQIEIGGDLAIPTGELLTNSIGATFAQPLIDNARTDVNGMSRAEAKVYMAEQGDKLQAEIDKVMAEKADDAEFKAGRDQVQAQILQQLNEVKRFTAKVNEQYATLAANFYSVMAARTGMTVQQFADTYKLGFSGAEVAGHQYDQNGKLVTDAPAFKEWFGDSKVAAPDGKPLVVYHGTQASFDRFDEEMQGSTVYSEDIGFFFTNDTAEASSYATLDFDKENPKPSVMPVFLSIQNPKIVTLENEQSPYDNPAIWYDNEGREAAQEAIDAGNDGLIVIDNRDDMQLRNGAKPTLYIAFNPEQIKSAIGNRGTFDKNDPNILHQDARGQIAFGNDITQQASIISMLKGADLSTFIHEGGHFFLEVQADLAARIAGRIAGGEVVSDGERSILDDMGATLAWMGVKATPEMSALDHWFSMTLDEKRHYHEQWARGFEAYAFEGKAPSMELQHVFQTFRAWLVNVYRAILKSVNASKTDIGEAMKVELTDEVRAVMDRMLATTEAIQEAEAARAMGPLFKSPEEGGMDLEAYKVYHDMGAQATLDAVDELQGRGLRDMQWLNNARSRKLKELQKQHDALRARIAREVRAEVLSQPIYRAWTFLTAKGGDKVAGEKPAGNAKGLNPEVDNLFTAIAKLGGLDRAEVKAQWGLDEKEKLESGVFGAPVVRKTGGVSIDTMAERLMDEGYLLPDEHGKADTAKLEELFDDQRRGTDRYSIKRDMAAAYGEQELNVPDLPEMGAGKLRTDELRRRYGVQDDAVWRKLSALRMTSDETGLDPDVVAELFGFTSGDELVQKLAQAEPPKSVIEGMTDQRMLQEHGDLSTPAGLERAADAAIHNDARVRFVATELRALQHAMSVREKVPGKKHTVDVLVQAAKEHASAVIARLKVRDIRPAQYAAAEVRAAKAAEKARGDLAKQAEAKRNQLINLYAAKAAYAAQDEVKAAVEYFKRFDTPSKTLDPEYREQIEALLERFDLRASTTLTAIDKRKSLVEWVQAQVDQGMEPDIPPELLQEANRKSFKEMTVEEVRGLRDSIKQIEHLGRLKNKLLTAKEQRDFQAAVGEITASIEDNARGREANTRTANTVGGKMLEGMQNFWASHIKAATWARVMDGGKDGGKVWEYLIRTANDAGNTEVVMREKATKELAKLVAPVLKEGHMGGKGEFYPSINRSLNKEARLAIALNMGNQSNAQRLLGGEGWTIQQIQPVLNSLSAADWQFVQAVWDHFETYRPLIAAKETRVYGKEPNWVEPTPVQTPFGVLRGGYYPIKYDPRASGKAEMHADAEAAKQQLKGAYTSATTRRSFTKTRAEEVNGRPLLYSMDGIYNGVQEVVHDLTWHEWLIDANKLLRNKKVDAAIRGAYGPDVVRQFKTWTEDNATGDRGVQNAGELAASWVRQGVSISGLGFNVMSALIQPLGLTQSIVRVGPKWIGRGLAKAIGAPIETADEINGKSEFMRTRALTRLREIAEVRSQVKGRTKAREAVDTGAYFLMMRAQQLVDVPTWWGAYEKAIAEGNGEDRAVALSDQAVIDSQGSGSQKDQSNIERGSAYLKLFTTFYSFFNTALNVAAAQTMTSENKAKLAADYLLLFTVPTVLMAVLKDAITPGDSGDWDDPEKLLRKLIGEQLGFLFGLMVGVRELTGFGQAVTGTAQYSTDYSGPAGLRMLSDAVKLGKQVNQGEADDGLRKAVINVSGELLRLPSAQVNRTVTGIRALNDGRTSNPAAVVLGYQEPN